MKLRLLILMTSALMITSVMAQEPPPQDQYDIASNWPEIHFKVSHLERIAGNRLLIGVKIYATPKAPPEGTLIGITVPIPKDTPSYIADSGIYSPKPFSIESAVMIDEATKQSYPALKPDPKGASYIPAKIIVTLLPQETHMMSIQFPMPPPPDSANGAAPAKQTISILLPNAKGPITGIIIPPQT